MIYEAKVNELAEEFGVHRNTIRNWINNGILPAEEGPGRRYLIQWEDYKRLCDKYSRTPRISPEPAVAAQAARPAVDQAPVRLGAHENLLYELHREGGVAVRLITVHTGEAQARLGCGLSPAVAAAVGPACDRVLAVAELHLTAKAACR